MSTQIATKQKSNEVIEGLQTILADSYALMAQTHLAHWNVEGQNFFQLHVAFQAQYQELFSAVDELAERLRALDALAIGGLQNLAKGSRIQEKPWRVFPRRTSWRILSSVMKFLWGTLTRCVKRPALPMISKPRTSLSADSRFIKRRFDAQELPEESLTH